MTRWTTALTASVLIGGAAAAADDGFKREGNPEQRAQKDALEGKAPPALQVQWLNRKGMTLEDLRGKVVVLDFWGVW